MTANTTDNDPLLWTAYHCPIISQNKGTGALVWVSSKPGCTKTTLHFLPSETVCNPTDFNLNRCMQREIFWWNLCLHMLKFSFNFFISSIFIFFWWGELVSLCLLLIWLHSCSSLLSMRALPFTHTSCCPSPHISIPDLVYLVVL